MYNLSKFGERLKELMDERKINAPKLAEELHTDRSNITRYMRGERAPLFNNFLAILNFFNCSADFILGLIEYPDPNAEYKEPPEFNSRLRYVIKYCGYTQYKLEQTKSVSSSELFNWLSGKKLPSVESLVKLAETLECSVDFLLGRI